MLDNESMDKIKRALKYLDLSVEEIDIFLATLQLGSASVLEIAKRVKIPRSTVYLHIDSLIQKKLLIQSIKGKKRRLVAQPPEKLIELAEDKTCLLHNSINLLKQELPQLKAIYNAPAAKTKVRYYEGVEGVKEIYEETLKASEINVHCLTQNAREIMGGYLDKYFVRVIRRMIKTREIVSDSKNDQQYQRDFSTSRNEIVCVPGRHFPRDINTDYLVWGNKIAFITYKSGIPAGVVIEDEEIARLEKSRFEMIWRMVKPNTWKVPE